MSERFGARDHGGPGRGPDRGSAATSNGRADETLGERVRAGRRARPAAGQPRLRRGSATSTAPASRSSSGCSPRRGGTVARSGRIGLTEHYREIFRITRLSDFMEIVEGDAA